MLQEQQGRTVTLLANEHGVQALFAVADPLRPQAKAAVAQLQALGVKPIVLSGDNSATVRTVAAEAGISDARGNMLPEDKLKTLSELQRDIGPTAMTGDGINDAPALAQADIGFAMGGMHATDMAMETADVVLMNDDLRRIPEVVDLAARAQRALAEHQPGPGHQAGFLHSGRQRQCQHVAGRAGRYGREPAGGRQRPAPAPLGQQT